MTTVVPSTSDALVDETLLLEISDAPPGVELTVVASATRAGVDWRSSARVEVDSAGGATLDARPWLWSLAADGVARPGTSSDEPWAVRFDLVAGHSIVATSGVLRRYASPGVERVELHERGLRGALYRPALPRTTRPAVVLTGSDGGYRPDVAALLASRGIPALALAHFAFDDLPPTLKEIPLEYFDDAIDWLLGSLETDVLAVIGISYGGLLALLLSSQHPEITATCSINGCGWVAQVPAGDDTYTSPFTRAGVPIPFTGPNAPAWMRPEARIPVERITGPVLLITGGEDRAWTATPMAQEIVDHRRRSGGDVEHLDHPDAGHMIYIPNVPHTMQVFELSNGYFLHLGGSPSADAAASAAAWPRVIDLLLDRG